MYVNFDSVTSQVLRKFFFFKTEMTNISRNNENTTMSKMSCDEKKMNENLHVDL